MIKALVSTININTARMLSAAAGKRCQGGEGCCQGDDDVLHKRK